MKVVHRNSLTPAEAFSQQSSLTIGNFDGCHKGHQELLRSARTLGDSHHAQTAVLTFDPHPREFFAKELALPRLFQPDQKLRSLTEQGVDLVVVQQFDYTFSQLSPEEFCIELLAKQLQALAVTVGYDFRFGKGRAGTIEQFRQFLPHCVVNEIGELLVDGEVASSSAIRNHLQHSQIRVANQLLGRSYLLEGTIQKGRQLGRTIGFPTANIEVKLQMLPQTGVYCGWVVLEKDAPIFQIPKNRIPAIMNIGYRPTIEQKEPQLLVETHLLAGEYGPDSLYGQPISIYMSEHIRGETKFSSLDALKEQIQLDCKAAKVLLGCS